MPDQLNGTDPEELSAGSSPDSGRRASPRKDQKASPGQDDKRPAKRRGPIINQRGPSEVDRALRMSQLLTGRKPPLTSKKPGQGGSSKGTVVRIERAKGFGFIMDSAGQQRFFHRSAVLDQGFDALQEQQTVEFEAHQDERGARALNVRPTSASKSNDRTPPSRSSASPKANGAKTWKSDLSPFRSGTGTSTYKRTKGLV